MSKIKNWKRDRVTQEEQIKEGYNRAMAWKHVFEEEKDYIAVAKVLVTADDRNRAFIFGLEVVDEEANRPQVFQTEKFYGSFEEARDRAIEFMRDNPDLIDALHEMNAIRFNM